MSKRISPLHIGLEPDRIIRKSGWEIALTYAGEMTRNAMFLTDLSHVPKWTVQGKNLDATSPGGASMPQGPGMATLERGMLLTRLYGSEARIMVLGDEVPAFEEMNYTDITDAYAALAVVGPNCLDVLSKLSSVDLESRPTPSSALAAVEEVTCQMVHLEGKGGIPGLIIAGARGYGHFLLDAFLDAGREYGIQPAGWERFSTWLDNTEAGL